MQKRKHLSFAFKLMLALASLAVVIGFLTRMISYEVNRRMLLNSMQGRLSDVAHTGSYLFDALARENISLLGRDVLAASEGKRGVWRQMQLNDRQMVVPIEHAESIMKGAAFLDLLQRLRQIKAGSTPNPQPLHTITQEEWPDGIQPQINFAYLYVRIPESPQAVIFIADSNFESADDNSDGTISDAEEGNPIGNLYVPEPFFLAPFKDGLIHVADQWYTDPWGTFISAAVPIKSADDRVIAVLGVDYRVDSEGNRLRQLAWLAVWLTLLSAVLSVLFASWLGRYMARPIASLAKTAERLRERDFSARVKVTSSDELGRLGETFNAMATEIENYAVLMEDKVAARTTELAGANARILVFNARLEDENSRMSAELEIAQRLQLMGLPRASDWAKVNGFEVAAFMSPASEVGGDYFDLLECGDQQALLAIGDVSGHGLDSGVIMLMVQAALQALSLQGQRDMLRDYDVLNRLLCQATERMGISKNMTLSLVLLDNNGRVECVGQHEQPLIIRADGQVEWIDTMDLGMPLGVDVDCGMFTAARALELAPGDTLALYTDGITEARNLLGHEFGTERMGEILAGLRSMRPREMLDELLRVLHVFNAGCGLDDDVTLMIIKRMP